MFGAYFQSQGFAVVIFDHRNWGDSDGTPRGESRAWTQVEEYHDAVTFVMKDLTTEVDPARIAIWGSSFSGGVVLIAGALDPRVKCVVSQVPVVSAATIMGHSPPETVHNLFADRAAHTGTSAEPTYIPLFTDSLEHAEAGDNGRILGTPEAWKYYEASNAHHRHRKDEFILQSLYHFPVLETAPYVPRISPRPLLIVNAKGDSVFPPTEVKATFEKAGEPKEYWEFDGGHFDAYYGPRAREVMVREAEFAKKYL